MSNGLNWADLMSGNVQIQEPKYYLKEEIKNNPEPFLSRFMDGLKKHLEKDIQKDVLSYRIMRTESENNSQNANAILPYPNAIINFDITLPSNNPEQSPVLRFFLPIVIQEVEREIGFSVFRSKISGIVGVYIQSLKTVVQALNSSEATNPFESNLSENIFKGCIEIDLPNPETLHDMNFAEEHIKSVAAKILETAGSQINTKFHALTQNAEIGEEYFQDSN
ncbi:MAG: hypothetical protein Q4E16_00010 [Neisseria sp.]|nr:hypothetical protein [Neisseria sp.]